MPAVLKPVESAGERLNRAYQLYGTIPISLRFLVRTAYRNDNRPHAKAKYVGMSGFTRLWQLRSPALVRQLLAKIDERIAWLAKYEEFPEFTRPAAGHQTPQCPTQSAPG